MVIDHKLVVYDEFYMLFMSNKSSNFYSRTMCGHYNKQVGFFQFMY